MKQKIGWVLTLLVGGLLLWSAFGKISGGDEIKQTMEHLGIDYQLAKILGTIEAIATVLFILPWTSFIGAILITGWMGGAILAHLRIDEPVLFQVIFPIIAWIGFALRRYSEVAPLVGLKR